MIKADIINFLSQLPTQPMNIIIFSENLHAGYTHCEVNGHHEFIFNDSSFFIINGGEKQIGIKYDGIYQIETGESYKYQNIPFKPKPKMTKQDEIRSDNEWNQSEHER